MCAQLLGTRVPRQQRADRKCSEFTAQTHQLKKLRARHGEQHAEEQVQFGVTATNHQKAQYRAQQGQADEQ